jgi:single-strand DNA-binding protein
MTAITMTVVGNLGRDPELRYTAEGHPVASFTIASTERVRDGDTWKDGAVTWVRCAAWRSLAEHAAETFHKGDRVIATGTLIQHDHINEEGVTRYGWELSVIDCGPSLKFATTRTIKKQS